ncbi:MAG: spiro-SPASM protein [Brevinematales bacterium]|nr:spiro-SPASM protein [Brevinematales bacterium]
MKKTHSLLLFLDSHVHNKAQKARQWFDLTLSRLEGVADEMFVISEDKETPLPLDHLCFANGEAFLTWAEGLPPHTQLIFLPAYAPLVQRSLLEKALSIHNRYLFDYTYAELPPGLMGEILDSSLAPFLKKALPKEAPLFRRSLKEWLGQDLSSYDCNIVFTDIRLLEYRLSFLPENHYQSLILEAMTHENSRFESLEEIKTWIENHPSVLRQVPTYIEIELTTLHEKEGPFVGTLPRQGEMSPDHLSSLLEQLDIFAPDAVISFGLYSEVFSYSHWENLLTEIHKRPHRRFLFESRGIFLSQKRLEEVLSLPHIDVIIDISTISPTLFEQWKKNTSSLLPWEGLQGLEFLHSLPSKEHVYIQMTRTHENDKELMRFYEVWKDFSPRLIIKKPDSFGGKNLSCRVVDLSPIKRTPCLSLQRNMVIFSNGDVPLCRQDAAGEYLVGNVFTDGVITCWKKLHPLYEKQFDQGISTPLCTSCDDWWIFSF